MFIFYRADLSKCLKAHESVESDPDVCRLLIQMVPDNNYTQYRTQFLSPKVGDMVVKHLKQTQKQELIKFLHDSKALEFSGLSTFRGAIVENMIHQLLQKGGKFKSYGPLGSYPSTKILDISPSTVNYVSEFQHSPKENIYYRPISSKFPVIDSWIGKIGLFQITTAKKKEISFVFPSV